MAGPTKVKAKEAGSTASTSNKLASNLTSDPKKLKAIEAAMEHIERQFGKGAIML